MNLKESFNYQNKLKDFMASCHRILFDVGFITTTKEVHRYSSVLKDKEDEEIIKDKYMTYSIECYDGIVMDIVDLYMDIIAEKAMLTAAIREAKDSTLIDIDAVVSLNKNRNELIACLNMMSRASNEENSSNGFTFTFNNEGNQIKVAYPIDKIVTIDFDRNVVKSILKKLRRKVDESSIERDKVLLETELIDFAPKYYDCDSIEECLEVFKKA